MPNKLVRWIHSGIQACASCLRPSDVKQGVPKMKKRKRRHFWMIRKSSKVGPDPRKENIKTVSKQTKDQKTALPAKQAKKPVKSPKPKSNPSCEGCKPHSPRTIKARLGQKLKTAEDDLQTTSKDTRVSCAQPHVVKVEDGEKVKVGGDMKVKKVKDGDKKVKVDDDRKVKSEDGTEAEDANAAVCKDGYGGKVASYVASILASASAVVATNNGFTSLHNVACAESKDGQEVQKPREDMYNPVVSDGQIVKTSSEPWGSLGQSPTPRDNSYAGLILNIADVIGVMKTSSYQSRARLIGEMFGGIHQRNESLYKLARSSMYAPAIPAHSEQAVSATRGSGDVDKADHSIPLSKSSFVGERPEQFQAIRHKPPRSPKRPAYKSQL